MFSLTYLVEAQNNALILNNDPYIVFNGGTSVTPIYLVVNQNNASGITTLGTGGNIISENEYNYVKWNIGTGTGNYTVPFTTAVDGTEQKIPLTLSTTAAGVGSGNILFSTYETTIAPDDNQPWPDVVTHFMSSSGNLDNNIWVIDRFWIIDAENYSTKPAVQLNFGFSNHLSEIGAPNIFNPANLGAQRFNTSNNHWEGSHSGSAGIWGNTEGPEADLPTAGNNRVENVQIAASEFYRAWTLTDYDHPLPLSLNYFEGNCDNSSIVLEWKVSSSEITTYEIQKSIDAINFITIGTTSSTNNETLFKYIDRNPYINQSYYRLVVSGVENDSQSQIISVRTCDTESETYIFSPLSNSNIYIELISKKENSTNDIMLVDLSGKIVRQEQLISSNKGNNQFMIDASNVAPGIYNVVLINEEGLKTVTKIIL